MSASPVTWKHASLSTRTDYLTASPKKYNLTSLAYYEVYSDIKDAVAREKQIKGWSRAKKIALIESVNPHWRDLSYG